jgi:hypothetical protein
MRKRSSVIVVIMVSIIVYALMFECTVEKGKIDISEAVTKQLRESESLCLEARKLNMRNWEQLWIIGPYVSNNDLGQFSWKVRWAVKRTGIQTRDDISVLLFRITESEYETFVEQRGPVDFVGAIPNTSINVYSPENIMCFSKSHKPPTDLVLTTTYVQRHE